MTLRAVVDSLEGIPESLRGEYVEKDGKFHLDLDNTISTHTSIVALSNSLRNAKNEKQALQAKVTALEAKVAGLPDDFDPVKYGEIVAELDALKKDPNRDKDTEARLQSMREQYEQRLRAAEEKRVADLAAKDEEISEIGGSLQSILVDGGLTTSLVKANIGPEFLDATKALLRGSVKVEKREDGQRVAVVETDLGAVPVEQFVDSWSKSDAGKIFVRKPAGGGGPGSGPRGSGEKNPWHKDSINRTEQGNIIRTDKDRARRLMKEAGLGEDLIRSTLI